MHFRLMAVILAGGICVIPALAEKKKAANSDETAPPPADTLIAQAGRQEPAATKPSSEDRLNQLLKESDDLKKAREEMHQFWLNNQPGVLTYEKASNDSFSVPLPKSLTKVYQVADLVIPLPVAGAAPGQPTQPPKTCERELIEKIMTAVEPKSWFKAGGKGTVEFFPIGMALVVNQVPTVHEKIDLFLDSLRKMQDQQVVTELRIITVPDNSFVGSGLAKELKAADEPMSPCKFLSGKEATAYLRWCKDAPGMQCLSAPMMTCLNGQPARVKVGQIEHFVTGINIAYVDGQLTYTPKNVAHDLGLEVTIEPTVSADGKMIRLVVNGSMREHGVIPVPSTKVATTLGQVAGNMGPLDLEVQEPKIITRTIAGRLAIPDGGSALLYGGKATIEETAKEPLPALSDVPHLTELFHNTRKQSTTNHLLVLVTSRIVSPEVVEAQCTQSAKCDPHLAKLLGEYSRACKEGKTDDARRLAIECLAIDPMCFAKK